MPEQRCNVIILTSGLSGSSVLTGLIARSGYWVGDKTHKKEYDTYENEELIKLNLQLFHQAGYTGNYTQEFSPEAIAKIASLDGTIDDRPYRQFLAKCDEHRPWTWKDPRLWLTIRFWKNILHLDECKFLLLTRSYAHSWVSSTLRRHIRSYHSLKRYEQSVKDSIIDFLHNANLPCLQLTYENLIVHPEETIGKLNAYLEAGLTVEDLEVVYHKTLRKVPRSSAVDFIKAGLIYVKNYSERIDIGEQKRQK
jgi:hypothetical protein